MKPKSTPIRSSSLTQSFSKLTLEEQGAAIDALQGIFEQSKEAKRAELMAELEKLGGPPSSARDTQTASGRKRASPAVAYRGPDGQTWSGRGAIPRWMKPLLTKGKTKEDFRV